MNYRDKKILNKLLPFIENKTITKKDEEIYNKILNNEWEHIRMLKESLLKYYPFAVYGL